MKLRVLLLLALPALTGVVLAQTRPQSATGIAFIKIAPGEFMMGCSDGDADCNPDERPRHRVQITRAFELGTYEVTQAQWVAVMGNNPSANKADDHPVENTSKFDALDFIAKLNTRNDGYRYRLPTEAEWEYAARAGARSPHSGPIEQVAWLASNSEDESHPVGQKRPNAWGLYDMQGNVREWVSDLYDETFYSMSPAVDPTGPPPCPNGIVDASTVGRGRGMPGGPIPGSPPPGGPPPGGPGFTGERGPGGPPPPGASPASLQQQIDDLRRQVQALQQQLQQLRNDLQAGPRGGRGGPAGPPGPGGRGLGGPRVCIEKPDGRGGQIQIVDPLDGLATGLPVARGGGWDQSSAYLRLSARFTYYGPTLRLGDIGFRVVRESVASAR